MRSLFSGLLITAAIILAVPVVSEDRDYAQAFVQSDKPPVGTGLNKDAPDAGPAASGNMNATLQSAVAGAQSRLTRATHQQSILKEQAVPLQNPGQINSRDDLNAQRKIITEYRNLCADAISALNDFLPYVIKQAQKAGFSEAQTQGVKKQVEAALTEADMDIQLQRLQADYGWAVTMLERLQLLEDYWGRWKPTDDHSSITSDDDSFIDRFELLNKKLSRYVKKSNRSFYQLID